MSDSAETFWRCDGCDLTEGLVYHVRRVVGGLAGLFSDPETWDDPDVDIAIADDGKNLRPAREVGSHGPFVGPTPECDCGRPMRRVVGYGDPRDWAEQFSM